MNQALGHVPRCKQNSLKTMSKKIKNTTSATTASLRGCVPLERVQTLYRRGAPQSQWSDVQDQSLLQLLVLLILSTCV